MNEEYSSGVLEYKYFTSNFQSVWEEKKIKGPFRWKSFLDHELKNVNFPFPSLVFIVMSVKFKL